MLLRYSTCFMMFFFVFFFLVLWPIFWRNQSIGVEIIQRLLSLESIEYFKKCVRKLVQMICFFFCKKGNETHAFKMFWCSSSWNLYEEEKLASFRRHIPVIGCCDVQRIEWQRAVASPPSIAQPMEIVIQLMHSTQNTYII